MNPAAPADGSLAPTGILERRMAAADLAGDRHVGRQRSTVRADWSDRRPAGADRVIPPVRMPVDKPGSGPLPVNPRYL